jgi:hypothetical protein
MTRGPKIFLIDICKPDVEEELIYQYMLGYYVNIFLKVEGRTDW